MDTLFCSQINLFSSLVGKFSCRDEIQFYPSPDYIRLKRNAKAFYWFQEVRYLFPILLELLSRSIYPRKLVMSEQNCEVL